MSFTFAFDVTARFYSQVPQGFQLAGYDTGSEGIAWTPAMWAAHPGAVHIDQDVRASDGTADVLDCEEGAVPVGSALIASWARTAQENWAAAKRPGQRRPAIYCSASNVTANVNALVKGGILHGVGLWVASWGIGTAAALAELAEASGPYPVIGMQFADDGDYDADVFSSAWLEDVSGDGWVFGPVRKFALAAHSRGFTVSFFSPGIPQKLGVGDYEVAVFAGEWESGPQAAGYPYYEPKTHASKVIVSANDLVSGTQYTVGVRAIATNGSHAGPWVKGTVTAR